jgi:type 1 glutamine amidotransferase
MPHRFFTQIAVAMLLAAPAFLRAAEPKIEEQPTDPKAAKIVLIAGSNFFKMGEHDYIAGCATLADLLKQTPGVAPVLARDWPKSPETFANAKAVVFFFDGGPKHGVIKADHAAQVQKLADAGVGLVFFHQAVDFPKDFGERARGWLGGVWEPGYSQRAHWVAEFKDFPDHPITRGVKPFKIDDGWLTKLRFTPELKGVTPLLRTTPPKAKDGAQPNAESIVGWTYDRPKGRSFAFTGGHLHVSLAEEGYRRFLTNGILWTAGQEIPAAGAPVVLDAVDLPKHLQSPPAKTK